MLVMKAEVQKKAKDRIEICDRIKSMITKQLNLEIEPGFITDDQPLFGRGLELDSIDALELSVGIYDEFNVSVTDDDSDVFSSVNTIADFVTKQLSEDENSEDGDDSSLEYNG